MSNKPHATHIHAQVFCAALDAVDYALALKYAEGSGQGRGRVLKPLLLTARADRTPTHLKDTASQLAMFDLFRNMDPEFRTEIGSIVEYVSVPKGEKTGTGK